AIIFIACGIFFLLSSLGKAGIAGKYVFSGLDYLFGAGFFLIPLIFGVIGVSFLKTVRPNFVTHRLLGGGLLFISSLGLVNVALGNEKTGGIIGKIISSPLLKFFDLYSSIVILVTLALIGFFIMFDTRLTLDPKLFGKRLWGKQDSDEDLSLVAPDKAEREPLIHNGNDTDDDEKNPPVVPAVTSGAGLAGAGTDSGFFASLKGFSRRGKEFTPPPLTLLSKDSGKPGVGDIKANSNIIKRTLANFGIHVEMDEISIGPSITRYALKPAEGVKLAKIVNLQNDLSLALAAHPLRIEAPIPGKSLVGIEIPNSQKTTVGLASILGSKEFSSSGHPLLVGLGRGISGMAQFANVAKAPHMLIAGATGSGKSVTIHTLITSLLYRNPPERLRFIMIDPKRVELTLYNKIPHLLTPVITDAKKAIVALRWAAKEMDRRYDILEKEAVRDIQSYHTNVLEPALKKTNSEETEIEQMPYIVIIIDELADIMSSYPRELEAAIVRLAQMSRAVGIHLMLSTQRPSVEVITGLIKANIPTRIALQVASQIDSRTILDSTGAEKLLGAGDMLYLSGDMSKPIRLQSAYISETEVKKVVEFIREQYADELPDEISFDAETPSGALFSTALDNDTGDDDDLYEDARQAVMEAGKASASYLQRKLKVGYARAARLLDMLEERGVIGPGDGAKPREVYREGNPTTPPDLD
ncbi:MAG: segregation ATPase FtsK/SpoIIIE, family, partial [Patescibacteria group bacterium]|nr:segregation ATPase FtsK/SpoIIIE, family [Patescibacteria group bacterium]